MKQSHLKFEKSILRAIFGAADTLLFNVFLDWAASDWDRAADALKRREIYR